jgi:hypothetical protein
MVYAPCAAGTAIAAGAPADGKLVKAFKGVGGSVMMTRYSVRFFGLLETISALGHLQRNAAKGAITDTQGAAIEALQHLSMLFYYGLEHYCYVEYASPGTFPAETVGKCERISCGAWFVWILLELAMIAKTHQGLAASGKLTKGTASWFDCMDWARRCYRFVLLVVFLVDHVQMHKRT